MKSNDNHWYDFMSGNQRLNCHFYE